MSHIHIRCPKCDWEPDSACRWVCDVCNIRWNTFETRGKCPGCNKVFNITSCSKKGGGCGEASAHVDWYQVVEDLETVPKSPGGIFSFLKNKNRLPVTDNDKNWVENNLIWLISMIDPVWFKSLKTIIPDQQFFNLKYRGTAEDAEVIFNKVILLLEIDSWELKLMFYSNRPTPFSDGIIATPSDKLSGSWNSSVGKYINNGLGNKEIWIEEGQLHDFTSLVTTIARQLINFKLITNYAIEKDELLADLLTIIAGFGIFMGNSYFMFSQWDNATHHGWQMRKTGYLPEQIIAYAMAWIAHFRNENIAWTVNLNKTMYKFFKQSYEYIEENPHRITWN